MRNGLIVEKHDTLYVFGGDMLYHADDLWRLEQFSTADSTFRSGASSLPAEYWPKRRVPYEYSYGFSSLYQIYAESAMADISAVCGVVFVPAQSTDTHRIVFTPNNGNSSFVGMSSSSSQAINIDLNTSSFFLKSTITHEILHALGFYHEHQRPDRDNYITINWSNIKIGKWHNFSAFDSGLCLGSFDFSSIMLYDSMISDPSFVYDTSIPAMTKIDYSLFYGGLLLSSGDVSGLQSIYGPPYHVLTEEKEVVQEYSDFSVEVYEEHVTTTIEFFADAARTIPAATSFPRIIRLLVTDRYANVNNQIETSSWYETITIPAGVSSYLVDDRNNYWREEWGSPAFVDDRDYVIVNSHF